MYLAKTIAEVREQIATWRSAGLCVALVPTMGNLHRGHLALIDVAAKCADKVAVSVFVNPLQFDEERDLRAYPRTLEVDLELLRGQHVALAFTPDHEEMYPSEGYGIHIDPGEIGDMLCGADRSGHFAGVATAVVKLFNIFEPDVAVFGEKDYQQLVLIKRIVGYLDFKVRIVAVPTVRDANGLALSSRNNYLNEEQKLNATTLYRALQLAAQELRTDGRIESVRRLIGKARASIESAGMGLDYVELRDLHTLQPIDYHGEVERSRIIMGAARVEKARLIDNVIVDETPEVENSRKC